MSLTMDNRFEKQYLSQIAVGDHKAFTELYSFYCPKVKHFIARFTGSQTEVEDLTQDIFEKIWETRKELPKIDSFKPYLYRITINSITNSWRKKNHHKAYLDYLLQFKSKHASIEDEIHARNLELFILLAVKNMPDQRRKVFEMSRYHELKNKEISDLFNISKRTVEAHLNLALKQIRKIIPSFLIPLFLGIFLK